MCQNEVTMAGLLHTLQDLGIECYTKIEGVWFKAGNKVITIRVVEGDQFAIEVTTEKEFRTVGWASTVDGLLEILQRLQKK